MVTNLSNVDEVELRELVAEVRLKTSAFIQNHPSASRTANLDAVRSAMTAQVVADRVSSPASSAAVAGAERLIDEVERRVIGPRLLRLIEERIDTATSDLHIQGTDSVVIHERDGSRYSIDPWFDSTKDYVHEIERFREAIGSRGPFDQTRPFFDHKTPRGVRVNGTLCANGRIEISCRYFDSSIRQLEDLHQLGCVSRETVEFLAASARAGLNIIVSGGAGSGKTTLLRTLLNELPDLSRVVTIEDAMELSLEKFAPHLDSVELVASNANSDGFGLVTTSDLFSNALRLNPDLIVVGEARDEVARELLSAMSTGARGAMSTLHARSARAVLDRLIECSHLSPQVVSDSVRNGVDMFVHLSVEDNRRYISSIHAVSPAREVDGYVRLAPILEVRSANTVGSSILNAPEHIRQVLQEFGWRP